MDEDAKQSAFISALTTEHFVLQTAANATVTEAAARSSLYVFALSSSFVAIGFTSQVEGVFFIFTASVLTAVFLLGLVSSVRLVDTAVENLGYLTGIADSTLLPRAHPRCFGSDRKAAVGADRELPVPAISCRWLGFRFADGGSADGRRADPVQMGHYFRSFNHFRGDTPIE